MKGAPHQGGRTDDSRLLCASLPARQGNRAASYLAPAYAPVQGKADQATMSAVGSVSGTVL